MKYLYIVCFCIFCSFSSFAQTAAGQPINRFEVRAGTWLARGGLKNTFEVAPSIGFFAGWPMSYNTALDFGFQMAFPINSQPYTYYHSKNNYELTESDVLLSMGLRLRHQITLAEDIYLTPYTYFGFNLLTTDLEKGEYYNEEEDEYKTTYYNVATLDVSGGVNLRYKMTGFFIEYHYTPYSIGNKVQYGFGNSALNIGISVSFF